jgi:hypothetical protein
MSELIEALDLAAGDARGDLHCPFDLNALVPIPPDMLRRGPDDPTVVVWLWHHWGTTWMLRAVEEVSTGLAEILLPDVHEAQCVEFWSADWTPWRALAVVRALAHTQSPPQAAADRRVTASLCEECSGALNWRMRCAVRRRAAFTRLIRS